MTNLAIPNGRILVVGGSRGIGLETVTRGLEAGYHVRALSRHPEEIRLGDPNLEKVAADATRPEEIAPALEGVDAVVLALGVRLTTGTVLRPVTLFSDATRAVTQAMAERGPRRLLAVTGFGTGDSRAAISSLEQVPFRAVFGRAYDDKDRQEEIVRASGLDWTIARPTILTSGPRTGHYRVLLEPRDWRNGMISRADVADFLVSAIRDGSHLHQAPVLAR